MAIKCGRGPQWSPLVKSGMTVKQVRAAGRHALAAMEPAREERDDPPGRRPACPPTREAAMEPAREERDDAYSRVFGHALQVGPQWSPLVKSGMTWHVQQPRRPRGHRAAMEPAREERDDPVMRASAGCRPRGRNGARS